MDLEKARKEYQALEEKKKVLLRAVNDDKNFYMVGGKKGKIIVEKQKNICKELKESFRLTEINRHVIAWRKKVMSHREIKSMIEHCRIPIEKIALVEWHRDEWDFKVEHHYDSSYFFSANYNHSRWETRKEFVYGGPKDPIQIFFKRVPGSGYQILGVFVNKEAFPKGGVFSLFAKGSEGKQPKKAA